MAFASQTTEWLIMGFSQCLATLRKERSLTKTLVNKQVGMHVAQFQRYENGSIHPTLDALRCLAIAR